MKRTPSKKISAGKKVVVAVSGGFDPVHVGHVRLFERARKLGDTLVVILNNDNWLMKKKGVVFMPEKERRELIQAFQSVDEVILTGHRENPDDMSVCRELKRVKPHIFAQGGDRHYKNVPGCEVEVCQSIGCEMVANIGHGGKVQSSSWLLQKYVDKISSKQA